MAPIFHFKLYTQKQFKFIASKNQMKPIYIREEQPLYRNLFLCSVAGDSNDVTFYSR